MKFTYASGKVDSVTGEFASITRSGFAGNLSINISGNFNAIIKRNLNVVIGNEERIIETEGVTHIIGSMGGQTALNLVMELHNSGYLREKNFQQKNRIILWAKVIRTFSLLTWGQRHHS